jgi:hypothetical protein
MKLVLESDASDDEILAQIQDVVDSAGLQAGEPPKPLESIALNDVRLITWMAVQAVEPRQ